MAYNIVIITYNIVIIRLYIVTYTNNIIEQNGIIINIYDEKNNRLVGY